MRFCETSSSTFDVATRTALPTVFGNACHGHVNQISRRRSRGSVCNAIHSRMQNINLPRQVRSVLESLPDALPLHELLILIDDFVLECTSSPEPEVLLFQLEEELQTVHNEVVDHSSLLQTEVFLAVLYHLCPILPSTSVISWFDIVLRPALREPKLPTPTVNHAKELIILALQKTEESYVEKVKEFRRRLMDLYLLDALNEGSGEDVLEWAELDEEQRDKRSHWKWNLEDVLLKFGTERPEVRYDAS